MSITNAQAVRFSNEKSRVTADLVMQAVRTIDQYLLDITGSEWEANPAVIAAQDSDPIVDGSETDGRKPVTKVDTAELKYVLGQLKACIDTDDRRALLNQWTTNAQPRF